MAKNGAGRPRSLETQVRTSRIVELRNQSWKWHEIASEVGLSLSRCHELYHQALAEVPKEHVVQARAEETQLVETAIRRLLNEAIDEDSSPRTRIEAWNSIRGWSEHRARMLGLNAPIKSQVLHISEDQVDAAIAELEAKLALQAAAPSAQALPAAPIEDAELVSVENDKDDT